MKALLLHPPYWTGGKKPLGYMEHPTVPLGLCYVASMLERHGVKARILDMYALDMGMESLEKRISHEAPDIVGITSMSCNFPNAVRAAKAIKKVRPEALVVTGGVHATFVHREIIENIPEIDVVVRYEGEYAFSELVQAVDRGRSFEGIRGLTFRKGGEAVSTPLRDPLEDLDALPYPAFHLLEPSIERYIGVGKTKGFPVITTRGCPYECIFCSTAAFHGHRYRTRKTTKVVDEIEYLMKKYGANNISFVDDNFTMQKARVYELCREIRGRKLSLKWGCSTRVDLLDEALLKTMNACGCEDIFFGIESASQEVLDAIKKRFKVQQAKEMVKAAERLGVKTHCSFILGLPGESAESLDSMIEFLEETKPTGRVLPNILDILPGTELYEKKGEYFRGRSGIPPADVTKTRIELLLKFYMLNFGIDELFRIMPPNIMVE